MGKHRVTLQTVADHVGVSRTTVSNAFSRPDQLSDDLRERVLAAARELNYAGPDPAARTLRGGSVHAVGVVLPERLSYAFTDPYAVRLLRGLAQATDDQALSLLLIPVPPNHLQEYAVRRAVVDSFFFHSLPSGHPVIEIALCRETPVVFVDGPEHPGHPFVGIDEHAAAHGVARHLLERGRRRLSVISFRVADDDVTGEVDDARLDGGTYRASRERVAGVLSACAEAGLARADVHIIDAGRSIAAQGRQAAAALLDGDEPPDAMVCLSDELAAGVVSELHARGLSVGGDVAVTGWDDVGLAEQLGITSVRQPDEEKGRIAGRWLVDGVRGPRREILPTRLMVRASTGA
ncbi:MAG TPA: LacI family DNA-binding transcriptional regulator [Euzebyales bacterium]|nr:LacI family DNA-binding transcriptional regulator [Euzebyales bacterium]